METYGVENKTVVLIDGVCHLCQGLVRFIVRRDPQGHCLFAPLQSEIGAELMQKARLDAGQLNTVVVMENGTVYTESGAVLRIFRRLRFPWPAAYAFVLVPVPLRNAVYRYVARNRYRWFGRDEACLLPTPEVRKRFL
ncbi:thiol-disulfide oxidoreductase DCC family protein [Paenibacillus sp. NFR01]|uniref:thiol-disulfide oxidoreductase DCC family protein n=1 Tax=Paenibacillus sp. NFR01 TaxID=1566279 RepID=UPI0008B9371C|nr:thiol-disulfide oxidoreductase DCC family protein [Paenibacillus sp. NFR01]SET95532.1 Predicted thiol-disulfide oxidoreductase YuxK, DCC family [Paenibacillus sp. NFR01]